MSFDADIVCAGYGPAAAGFLTTLARELPSLESRAMPGMPPQVICYERADDLSFGVSGVVTRGRAIRETYPDLPLSEIPLAAPVTEEKVFFLTSKDSLELPYTPPFLNKHGGFVASIGQFNQWTAGKLMETGLVQLWTATPVTGPLKEEAQVKGVVLHGGMEVRAALTVAADGPVGALGRALEERSKADEWAVGMKFVIDLPESCTLQPGTVWHTIGYPAPEIFGFFYVHPDRVASVGLFVPSWMRTPERSAYEYLQQLLLHPSFWSHVKGGRLRSWGAKSLNESGRRGEPRLVGDGWARIGEGSGSTNVLTGSGVDEAWYSGTLLAEAVIELYRANKDFSEANLTDTYVRRRRASRLEKELKAAENARNGFRRGAFLGFLGMGLTGMTGGLLNLPLPAHDAPREWKPAPAEIPYDGQLLVSHQDALLMGGKVQGGASAEDHVTFRDKAECTSCGARLCIPLCSGQALHASEDGTPAFDREKCVFCGACLWNCTRGNVNFAAAPGGLHSAEN